uniref:Reverse transcriptase domain-containing protein n=1 Tax=Cannabis sativa TaxID=3483 RepID=A0A803QP51_CANSA
MESLIGDMSSKIVLSEKERAAHVLTESDLQVANIHPQFFLVARCLSNAFNPKTFVTRMGEFWSKKCRFEVTVSKMHSELYLLTLGCAGDKLRLMEGEPWHYNNFLIVLHSLTALHNVSKEDLNKVQIRVQVHRLPFLSKSCALACKIGEWIGEYIDVHEDSLHEGWGSFLRVRVRLDIHQPLMRGKLVKLPHIRDEHWLEFRYENLPTFCFHCGCLGHPFERCVGFLEMVDEGIEPELPYSPELLGDKLPKSGYERYRNDFSKANAYPFLTRLTRKSINSIYPKHLSQKHLFLGSATHPTLLTIIESSSQSTPEKHLTTAMPFVHSTHVATYPPSPLTINLTPKHSPFTASILTTDATSITTKAKGKAIYKRQVEPENMRSVLKRYRNSIQSEINYEGSPTQLFSSLAQDSSELQSSFPAVGRPQHQIFHTKASARNSTNKIKSLKDADGNTVTDRDGISNIISHYFQELFTAKEEDHWALSHVLFTILTTINDDHNEFLLRDFTKEDVYFTLKSMASNKSPGLDGMSAMFYHHHWYIVGNLVSSVVLHILNENGDPTIFKKTLLTLIPKVKKPNSMKDFHPISLWNVVYKLVSKMIFFRFKDVLPFVISETQSAFLPNRLITDNVLVAFEMIHSLKHRKKGSKGYAAIKLDMSKAFDYVEWSFLAAVMVVGSITPQRGLRQGDPLFPYIFLICSEGLSRLLQYEERIGQLKGYVVSRRAPMISHLFFADDSLLFCQVDGRSCGSIKCALDIYHRALGQELNLDKSVMYFSPNTPPIVQNSFQNILGMSISDCHEKYLGLPTYSERDKNHQLEQMMANFWWGSDKDKKKTHWRKWKLLCKTKMDGGMGFRSVIHFNQALLVKQAWRIIQYPNSLLSRVLKGRYFSHNDFLQAQKTGCSSLTWQGICWGRDLLVKGLRLKIGDGSSVKCISDPWIPRHSEFTPIHYLGDTQNLVSFYISDDKEWNLQLLTRDFSAVDIDYILSIPLASSPVPDQWILHFTNSNEYTVQTGYHLANDLEDSELSKPSNNQHTWWKYFWNLKLASKVKIFVWKAFHRAIPTAASLCNRKIIDYAACSLCSNAWESVEHALFLYKHAKKVWHSAAFYYSIKDSTGAAANSKWFHPPLNELKMNVDAACDVSHNKIGVGLIIQNSSGQVVAAYSKPLTGRYKSQEIEAKALLTGLDWATQCNLSVNHLESDSLVLVNSINSKSTAISSFGDLVLDIKNRLSYLFSVCVSYVKRDANQAAHGLAKQALVLDDDCMWFEEIPSTIFSVVVNDSF